MLVDASGLIALLDRDDPDHDAVRRAMADATLPVSTTWAALTEASHVARRRLGVVGQRGLFGLIAAKAVDVADLPAESLERIEARMDRYADLPMDLADATLVEVAEQRSDLTILTLDHHFRIYRVGRRSFTVLP